MGYGILAEHAFTDADNNVPVTLKAANKSMTVKRIIAYAEGATIALALLKTDPVIGVVPVFAKSFTTGESIFEEFEDGLPLGFTDEVTIVPAISGGAGLINVVILGND